MLIKICRKKPKQRQFFLFNDILVYGTILIKKRKYTNQRVIPLEEMQIEELQSGDEGKSHCISPQHAVIFSVRLRRQDEK